MTDDESVDPATKFDARAAQVTAPVERADDRPSIAALQREVPRWPTNWKPALGEEGEWLGFWWCRDANGSEDRVSADVDEDYANDFARIVALTRNSAPVLLEIAAAALAWRGDDQPRTHDDAMEAVQGLLAAISKVRP